MNSENPRVLEKNSGKLWMKSAEEVICQVRNSNSTNTILDLSEVLEPFAFGSARFKRSFKSTVFKKVAQKKTHAEKRRLLKTELV